jgi:hypothetical protein
MQLKLRSTYTPPTYVLLLTWKYAPAFSHLFMPLRIHTFHSDPPKTSSTPILGVNYPKRYSIVFIPSIFLLAYKAPNISIATSF